MVNDNTIIKAIEKALTDKRKGFGKLNIYGKGVVKELESNFKKKRDINNQ